jgi:ATP-dependent helicase/nuclease subunit A
MWEGPAGWQSPMDARVCTLLGIPADANEAWATGALDRAIFPDRHLAAMLPLMLEWKAQAGQASADFIPTWLELETHRRPDAVERFFETVLTKKGEPRKMANPTKIEPMLPQWQEEIAEAIREYQSRLALLDLATFLAAAFEVGRAFWVRWEDAKRREGLLDFGDLIRKAARLLGGSTASDWIRYKLDRTFDHILIDEAQDTNRAQWDIVDALIDDFFSGEGAAGDKLRTIFTVGDYKQAIFRFQGTSPENYERAKLVIHQRILDAQANAHGLRDNRLIPQWRDLDLGRSFRTSSPVLDFVNNAIDDLGYQAFGLPKPPEPHLGDDRPGLVTLWEPVRAGIAETDSDDAQDEEREGKRDWLPRHETVLADRIARQVARWIDGTEPFVLAKGDKPRPAGPGDIMVLVRRRRDLAAQIVAQLHARGVPVAGVDRLRLGAPLAVKDLMAALRFAAQPLDDLALANLLGSPLIGWSQEDLLEYLPRDKNVRLWDHLRRHPAPPVEETCQKLREVLARADFETPQALLAWLLTGPWQGRARLVARLGREANDPIDELVNAAFAYESANVPSLAGFIEWFDAGTSELKRDADGAGGLVRVMTVHGSKGLQAPIVILADATGKPGDGGDLELDDDPLDQPGARAPARKVPLPGLAQSERVGPVEAAKERSSIAEMQEHWRLLYVAMTRAEEALFIGGSLGAKQKEVPPDSWYSRLAPLFTGEPLADPIWLGRRERGHRAGQILPVDGQQPATSAIELPDWARRPIGPEPRPPRPLAPSAAGEDLGSDPPLAPEIAGEAARRGVLLHRLLERLPDLAEDQRRDKARNWLERQASELDDAARAEILESALAVLDHPDFAAIFGPEALAEVPLAATVNGVVIAGTADRLLVQADTVTVVDFKTTRRPPEAAEAIPLHTVKQMAAYVAALEVIYPGRAVRAGVLYTHSAALYEIAPGILAPHKQHLGAAQQSYAQPAIDAY